MSFATDPACEITTACLAAIGAATSTHSAIIGTAVNLDHLSLQHAVALSLGRRRQAACQILAHRALDLARKQDVLARPDSDPSLDRAASLLMITALWFDPYGAYILALYDRASKRRASAGAGPDLGWVRDLVMCEAMAGIMWGRTALLDAKRLATMGFRCEDGEQSREVLRKAVHSNECLEQVPDLEGHVKNSWLSGLREIATWARQREQPVKQAGPALHTEPR